MDMEYSRPGGQTHTSSPDTNAGVQHRAEGGTSVGQIEKLIDMEYSRWQSIGITAVG
jgi:hypothetical protein